MAVTPVAFYQPSNYNTMGGTQYPLQIDANSTAAMQIVDQFSPRATCAAAPALKVALNPGSIFSGVTLTNIGAYTNCATTSGSPTVTVNGSTSGIVNGQLVTGTGIPDNTTATISGSTVTLSNNATATSGVGGVTLQFCQLSGSITAPVSHPRIDRAVISATTGALSIITGTEATNPSPPAITAGSIPIAQILLQTTSTYIANSMITDERKLGGSGDVSSNTTTSVDSEVALFSGTGAKTLKRATGTGYAKLTSGVLSAQTGVPDSDVTFTNITTGNATASAHGYLPILANTGTKYLRDDGTYQTIAQLVVQIQRTGTTSQTALSTGIPMDNTVPQNTEGTQVMTKAITPTSSSNKLVIEAPINLGENSNTDALIAVLYQDSGQGIQASMSNGSAGSALGMGNVYLYYEMTAGTTSSTTFKVNAANGAGTGILNASSGFTLGGTFGSYLKITELTQ